jgi:competence protein ComGC
MKRAFTLVSTLVTIAIILILAIVITKGTLGTYESKRADKKDNSVVGAVMYKAKDTVCQSNLSQARDSLYALGATDAEDHLPATLAEAKLPSEITHCPVGKEEYVYDPARYEETKNPKDLIHCPHKGHEKY